MLPNHKSRSRTFTGNVFSIVASRKGDGIENNSLHRTTLNYLILKRELLSHLLHFDRSSFASSESAIGFDQVFALLRLFEALRYPILLKYGQVSLSKYDAPLGSSSKGLFIGPQQGHFEKCCMSREDVCRTPNRGFAALMVE
jgi:hypothetical protein